MSATTIKTLYTAFACLEGDARLKFKPDGRIPHQRDRFNFHRRGRQAAFLVKHAG